MCGRRCKIQEPLGRHSSSDVSESRQGGTAAETAGDQRNSGLPKMRSKSCSEQGGTHRGERLTADDGRSRKSEERGALSQERAYIMCTERRAAENTQTNSSSGDSDRTREGRRSDG